MMYFKSDDFNVNGSTRRALLGCKPLCYHFIIITALGESFRDSLTPFEPLSGYDPSNGVAIRNSLPRRVPHQPAGLEVHDNHVDLIGLQFKSVHGAAVEGKSTFGKNMTICDFILDSRSEARRAAYTAATTDAKSVIANSLIISHAPIGIVLKCPGFVVHSTIVNHDHVAGIIGIETFDKRLHNTTVSNTAVFGFAHAMAFAHEVGHNKRYRSCSPQSSHNATDAPSGDPGTGHWPDGDHRLTAVDVLPDTMHGVSVASVFITSGSDWRLSPTSPLRGTGDAFGSFSVIGSISVNCPPRAPHMSSSSLDDLSHDLSL